MLNRLYIVVGIIAILVLAAAFVVPRFIDWDGYRPRMEAIVAEALGTDVAIKGPIDFSLLPQPRLRLHDVVVGPEGQPFVKLAGVNAEFSLVDFLRDRYVVTSLVLDRPAINLHIDAEGRLDTPISLPEKVSASNIAVADATVVGGAITLSDGRSNKTYSVTAISADLRMSNLRGPFSVQGTGTFDSAPYALKVTANELDADGKTRVSLFVRPESGRFSLSTEGLLATGARPDFSGDLTLRQTPQAGDAARGDMVLQGKLALGPDKLVLSDYTLEPDENRAGTRLTGAASISFGAAPKFDAVVSGGVVGLAPRSASEQAQENAPYELVRLLEEAPKVPLPPMPGKIGIDIAELDLRAVSLRDLRADLRADGKGWTLDTLEATLPGDTDFRLRGRLENDGERPAFAGNVKISTDRFDALALNWRKPAPDNPLFDMPGRYSARVTLTRDALRLDDGQFDLDGVAHKVSGEIGIGKAGSLALTASLGELSPEDSAALLALLPDIAPGGSFGSSFPSGKIRISAPRAEIFDLALSDGIVEGSWSQGELTLDRLAAKDLGGIGFDLTGSVSGTLSAPVIAGNGSVSLDASHDAALAAIYGRFNIAQPVREFLSRSLPARLNVDLGAPDDKGAQALGISGSAGAAAVHFDANLSQGIGKALSAPLTVVATINADDPTALTAQLGLGGRSLVPEGGPMSIAVTADGAPGNSLDTRLSIGGSGDELDFSGNLIVSDPGRLRGKGKVNFTLSDGSLLAELAGAGGVYVPRLDGSADISFIGAESVSLSNIGGKAGGANIGGDLTYTVAGGQGTVAGALRLGSIDATTLLALMGGPTATLGGDSRWPDGPFSIGDGPRRTQGRIGVTTPAIRLGDTAALEDAGFDFVWDDKALHLRGFEARLSDGTVDIDANLCCSGALGDKQASGRVSLKGVPLSALLPKASAQAISGTLDASGQYNATGDSLGKLIATLSGDGSFTLSDLSVARFDPAAFSAAASVDNIIDLDAEALRKIVVDALDKGTFAAPRAAGVFTLAGGVFRTANVAADAGNARLFGGGSLDLSDLGIGGRWEMTPTTSPGGNGLIDATTADVAALLSGTLDAPERELDLGGLVDTIKMKAYEAEVQRLEKLKAEEDARAKAAAEEAARQAEAAAAAARKAADEAAAKKAAEEAAAQKAAQDAAAAPAPTPTPPPSDTQNGTPLPDLGPVQEIPPITIVPPDTVPPSVTTLPPPTTDPINLL